MADLKENRDAALCIVPPAELWGEIQVIREDHDTSFDKWFGFVGFVWFYWFCLVLFDLGEKEKKNGNFSLSLTYSLLPFSFSGCPM